MYTTNKTAPALSQLTSKHPVSNWIQTLSTRIGSLDGELRETVPLNAVTHTEYQRSPTGGKKLPSSRKILMVTK